MTRFGLSEPIVVGEYDEETNTYKNVKKLEDMAGPMPNKAEIKSDADLDYTSIKTLFQKDSDKFMENVCNSVISSLRRTDRFHHLLDNEKYLLLYSKIEDIVRDIFDISPDTNMKMYMFQNDDGLSIHIGNTNSIFMTRVEEIFRKTQCMTPKNHE